MVLTYILTLLIVCTWIFKSIIKRKVIFSRTILDIPLLIFLATQLLSTLISVDVRTSIFGYYSRFNGGFLSILSFSLLYWAFVSNFNSQKTKKFIKALFISSLTVSIYGILEHFGIDKNIWVQDVQERVFSTLGQPNWLAAWIITILPLTWSFLGKSKKKNLTFFPIAIILFLCLLYTKSRSGILAFAISSLLFLLGVICLKLKKEVKNTNLLKIFILLNLIFLIINLFTKTPWTPNFSKIFTRTNNVEISNQEEKTSGTVLETGGTESGTIRKLVWKGAIDTWKAYPILGSGVETFAFSFYKFRPKDHNLVSEWDFLYNKAHNEYLNFLATTGTLGFLSYIFLVGTILYIFISNILKQKNNKIINLALLSGFISILITNFFGFSVVPINIQFFLFPAISFCLQNDQEEEDNEKGKLSSKQKFYSFLTLSLVLFLLIAIVRYWLADLNYAKAKRLDDAGMYSNARIFLQKAVSYSSKEAIFWTELAENSADLSLALNKNGDKENSDKFMETAIEETKIAEKLSPKNIGILRQITTVYLKMSDIDLNYLFSAKEYLEKTIPLSPNDAKLVFNLGLIYANTIDVKTSIVTIEKAIDLKPNYKQARSVLATLYQKESQTEKAKEQLEYILKNIDPNDTEIKERLEEIKSN